MDIGEAAQSAYRIGIYPVPGFALLSYACTVEPLRAANLLRGEPSYEIVHFASDGYSQSSGVAGVPAEARVGEFPALDLLLVIAGGDPALFSDAAAIGWLRQMARRGVRLGGVSGGPVILAKAGLMDGRRMTVHWEHAPVLEEMSPQLVVEKRLYVIDRDRVTCGGGTAPLDLMHALIAERHGGAFARRVSDWFLHTEIRAAADPQRAGPEERLGTSSAPILDAVAAMEHHVADTLTLPQLAGIAGVSPRQLNRLFRERFRTSTMSYYRNVRLEVARNLLNASTLSVTEIALATGFAGSAHFSRAFAERFGLSPSRARRREG